MATNGVAGTEEEQRRFFEQLIDGFHSAAARTGEIVRDFRVAGTPVRLRFAGDALIPVMVPGLAYPVDHAQPECEICLWDSETTGIPLPPPPRPWEDFTARGNIWGFDSARYRSAYHWGEGSVNVMDRETRRAVYWLPSFRNPPAWVVASPLRSILHWWMELNGLQLVHAAAVGQGGRGVLIPGRGGSGKSSTALACLLNGLDFIGDDYLALALDPEPRVYRLYSTAKLDPRSLGLYPELKRRCRAVRQAGFDKVVLFLEDEYQAQLCQSLALQLVLKPYISGVPETTFGPTVPRAIEHALASETLAHLPQAGASTVKFLERVSHEVPHAAIHLGTERARIASTIQAALTSPATSSVAGRPDAEQRPFVSVLVHFSEEDRAGLRKLAAEIDAQAYPRTELVVTADGAAGGMADEVARLPGIVRFFPFDNHVAQAVGWNRGIRESFSELVMFIVPGDLLGKNALATLVDACATNTDAAWVQGRVLSGAKQDESARILRGALIRKSAFRDCGVFVTNPLLQGREQTEWMKRAGEKGLVGHQIENVTLHAACGPTVPVDLSVLRTKL